MSQHDMDLENQAGAAFRADLNEALKALVGQSSGDTAPATAYAFMRWFDTANEELKERDGDNASWRVVAKVVNEELVPYSQGAALSPYGLKNLLINGNFAINQREYVSGTPTTAANQFTLDRWYVAVSGESVVFTASGNGNQVTAPAGGFSQAVLGKNIRGGEYTLSWTGTATAEVNGAGIANGGQVTLPANTNAKVTFIGGTVEEAQLERGSVAAPFELRFEEVELGLCRFFFRVFGKPGDRSRLWAGQGNNAVGYFPIKFPPMRTTPVVSISAGLSIVRANTAHNVSVWSVNYATADSVLIRADSSAMGSATGEALIIENRRDAGQLGLSLDAELVI